MKKIKRLGIANRGEVAVRIIRAAQELGIETVLLHSTVDKNTKAYRLADKTICIGAATTAESYLNIEANVQGALSAQCDAVHPGFGFLSENADFASALEKAGIIFVGPSAQATRTLGDKVSCKKLAQKLGIPLVPGYEGEDQSVETLLTEVKKIGYPVIVKAAAGGGGRGMKLITRYEEAQEAIASAQREALAAFGSEKVFLEKYLDHAKHIEFQIFGDASGKVISCFDRECSVQRRHQKIIEEALSPSLTTDLRRRMSECAVMICESAGYRGAGTVEFLLQDGNFYLLEVNTRLQVEHPVTEMVMGIDLVKAQILTAQNESVFNPHQMLSPRGHSIECRLYAEDPFQGGIPSTGKLGFMEWPEGPGRRFEVGFEEGDEVTAYYDPMIAKVIVWDESRPRAIQKMIRVLRETVVFGIQTNIPYLIEILSHPEFVDGTMTTRFIEKNFANPLRPIELSDHEQKAIEKIQTSISGMNMSASELNNPWMTPWRNTP